MKKVLLLSLLAIFLVAGVASANHAWGKYHWDLSTVASESSPLKIGNNLNTPEWNISLAEALSDWNTSVLHNQVVAGGSDSNCSPTSGQVEVCNKEHGENGWLGIASIWVTRGRSNHITQGVVQLNDTYFKMPQYNSQAWRDFVMCQEVGHEFGLGHQDENFYNANLGTCMDYTDDPDGSVSSQLDNRRPNQHDFDQMTSIYAHLNETDGGDGGDGGGGKPDKCSPWPSCKNSQGKNSRASADISPDDPSSWGRAVSQDARGNDSVFEKDLGDGRVIITHVLWIK